MTRSSIGTNIAAATTITGESRTIMSWGPYRLCEIFPEALVEAAARTSPISMDPESPMKIRAGWKLWGRNPMSAPARTAVTSAGG